MSPTEAEIAWAAGLFEGEGCLRVNDTYGAKRPRAELVSTDEDVVRRFHAIVGVGNVHGPYPSRNPERGHKPKTVWACAARADFAHVAALLEPWLGQRRRAKLREVMAHHTLRHRGQKLSDDDVRAIRTSSETNRTLGQRYGVHPGYVGQIKRGAEPGREVA